MLGTEIAAAERDLAVMEADVAVMRDSLAQHAIRQFVAGGEERYRGTPSNSHLFHAHRSQQPEPRQPRCRLSGR